MELATLIAFAVLAATLVAVPGPDWAFIITAGARDRVVVPAVGGVLLDDSDAARRGYPGPSLPTELPTFPPIPTDPPPPTETLPP
ncbi:MAG: hypothetical protein ACKOXM_05460, partial [Agromyces sp.]